MGKPRIRDIKMFREGREATEGMLGLRRFLPWAAPFLRVSGVNTGELARLLDRMAEVKALQDDLASLPDRFNDLFAERGWIAYEPLSVDLMRTVVRKAEAGDIEGAEDDLVAYYDEVRLRFQTNLMRKVRAFAPRMRLAELALEDHLAGRLHASIPLVLMLADGLVSSVHPHRHGMFREGTRLEAWNSLAGHSTGLTVLARLLGSSRTRTTTTPIAVPYRHGILHGMDLAYANPLVAAKAWAALFAIREWALKAERGELDEPEQVPDREPTLTETLASLQEIYADRQRIEEWQPRRVLVGQDVPSRGTSDQYGAGTPEQALVEFLEYWQRRNYGYMARRMPTSRWEPAEGLPAKARRHFTNRTLLSFKIGEVEDVAAAITEVAAQLAWGGGVGPTTCDFRFRMVYEDALGNAALRGKPSARWVVQNWFLL